MEFDHDKVLRGEIRWSQRGIVVELNEEVELFFMEENPASAGLFHSEKWLYNLSYLTDTFERCSELNTPLSKVKMLMCYFCMIK
jgi:hypothetical protein